MGEDVLSKVAKSREEKAQKKEESGKERDAMNAEAMVSKQKIESVEMYTLKRKVAEGTNKLYGSVTQQEVAEAITIATAVPVRISSVMLPSKVNEIGEVSGTVELTPDVTAYFKLSIVPDAEADQ